MLARLLKSRGVHVIEDARASKRDNYAPASITTNYTTGDVAAIMTSAVSSSPCPVALVTDTGRVFVLSAGGSGEIVVVGEPTPDQDDAVLAVMEVLHDLWGVKQPAPKKNRKKVEVTPEVYTDAEVLAGDIAELAESIEVLEVIAEGEYDNAE